MRRKRAGATGSFPPRSSRSRTSSRSQPRAAGPLLIPPDDNAVEETLDAIDGLILSGGADLDPALYGAGGTPRRRSSSGAGTTQSSRCSRAALDRELPVLAICRGMQVLNVLDGGELHQHMPELVGPRAPSRDTRRLLRARCPARSRQQGRCPDRRNSPVKSHHHQGLSTVGEGLEVTGWAEDGSIEAIEDRSHRFVVGVLWHPEEGEDKRLFEALVEEARAYRGRRRS